MNFEKPEEWLTASDVAKLKGIHRNNVAKAARQGRLPAVSVGGRWLFRRADVENATVRNSRKPSAASAAAQARITRLRAMQQRLAPGVPPVDQYLAAKHEESLEERRRDERWDAERP